MEVECWTRLGLRNVEEESFRIFYIVLANDLFLRRLNIQSLKTFSPKIIEGFISIFFYTKNNKYIKDIEYKKHREIC